MSYTCPVCKRISHNPNDERSGYCAHCHEFTRRPPHVLWRDAGGDRAKYIELLKLHGHLIEGEPEPGRDIPRSEASR